MVLLPNNLLSLVFVKPPNAKRLPLEQFAVFASLCSSRPKLKADLLTLPFVVVVADVVAAAVWLLPPKEKEVPAVVVTAANF